MTGIRNRIAVQIHLRQDRGACRAGARIGLPHPGRGTLQIQTVRASGVGQIAELGAAKSVNPRLREWGRPSRLRGEPGRGHRNLRRWWRGTSTSGTQRQGGGEPRAEKPRRGLF
jgi:hypothetical protein